MFGMEKMFGGAPKSEKKPDEIDGMEGETVVAMPMKKAEESVDIHQGSVVVDPSTGSVIGTAGETQADAVRTFRQAQIDAREAA